MILPRTDETFFGLTRYEGVSPCNGEFELDAPPAGYPSGKAGVAAGHSISIKDTEETYERDRGGTGAPSTKIRLTGFTDIGTGWLDANVDGSIDLTEVIGDLTLGFVRSRLSDVTLTAADGSIVDTGLAGDLKTGGVDPADVQGANIKLTAIGGDIGTSADFVETNLDDTIAQRASEGLREGPRSTSRTAGNLRIDVITNYVSTAPPPPSPCSVTRP